MATKSGKRPSRIRFGLRTLLVVVTLIGLVLGLFLQTAITADQAAKLDGCEWIRRLDLSGTKLKDDDLKSCPSIRLIVNLCR